jgi:phosphohistidine phosphatase SixA
MLGFKSDFEELLAQNPNVAAAKRAELIALQKKILHSRASRAQKTAFLKLSFVLELLNYYENQSTESPDVIFAQKLPPLVEQLVITSETDALDEKLIRQAEELLAFIINADYRQAVVNNFGKAGGAARTLRFVLTFRSAIFTEHDPVTGEFVKHLLGGQKNPPPEPIAATLRLVNTDAQKTIVRAILNTERLRREDAEALGKALIQQLGLPELPAKSEGGISSEKTQMNAWDIIKELIAGRASPNEITEAIRKQLHAKYDADEVKHSWLILSESDPMTLVRVFCLLPYLPDGQTDPVARAVLESYANRLTHEKYAATYAKVIHALRNLFKVKADSPALVNFIALVKWVDPDSAAKIAKDIGMTGA